ncbi:MAG: FixH family protein [Gammaproteobacteria bacterium]|nr:FixH family protein [Gammaproteobacteria bacterium]
MNEVADIPKPWFKQFWPWFLISLPASAVFAGIATIIIANVTYDGLVVDDYYKQGLAINADKKKHLMASHLGLSAEVQLNMNQGQISVQLDSNVSIPQQQLTLDLVHPTRSGKDISLVLQHVGNGLYTAQYQPVRAIRWNISLSSEQGGWILQGRHNGKQHGVVLLTAE